MSLSSRALSSQALSAWLLAPVLALGCGARSAIDCFGETCAALEAGVAGGAGGSGGSRGGAGGGVGSVGSPPIAALGGTGGGRNPEIPVPDDTPIVRPGNDPVESGTESNSRFCGPGKSSTVQASVSVSTYAELERYTECQEIEGDLIIRGADFEDLRPLGALRRVGGSLILNTTGSLRGLGALEEVESLVIEQFRGDTLSPLRRLARVLQQLSITGADRITDLSGLGALVAVQRVELIGDGSLQTLDGLNVPRQLDGLRLLDLPELRNVSALAPLERVDAIEIQNTALSELNGLQNLSEATSLALADNAALGSLSQLGRLGGLSLLFLQGLGVSNANGLEGLKTLENVIIQNNPNLVDVDALGQVQQLTELSVISNPVLARLPQFSNAQSLQKVHVRDNALLASGPLFPIATNAEFVVVSENPSLTALNGFASLTSARSIEITDNPALSALDFSQLTSARTVRIYCNISLDEASLEPLRSVSGQAIISGNLGSPTSCESDL
jgi:hypothetical protein